MSTKVNVIEQVENSINFKKSIGESSNTLEDILQNLIRIDRKSLPTS